MCKNIVELIRPQVTIWHISVAFWISKATNTLLECVILTVFHCNIGCTNVSHCYIICALLVMFIILNCHKCWGVWGFFQPEVYFLTACMLQGDVKQWHANISSLWRAHTDVSGNEAKGLQETVGWWWPWHPCKCFFMDTDIYCVSLSAEKWRSIF